MRAFIGRGGDKTLFAEGGVPVGLVPEIIVVDDVGDDGAAEFDGVDSALMLVDDFTVWL